MNWTSWDLNFWDAESVLDKVNVCSKLKTVWAEAHWAFDLNHHLICNRMCSFSLLSVTITLLCLLYGTYKIGDMHKAFMLNWKLLSQRFDASVCLPTRSLLHLYSYQVVIIPSHNEDRGHNSVSCNFNLQLNPGTLQIYSQTENLRNWQAWCVW